MKKFLTLIMIILLNFSLVACNNKIETDTDTEYVHISKSKETSISLTEPEVLTDLFDGERRIWYYVNSKADSLSFSTEVKAVFVTENKKVIELYYNIIPEFIAKTLRETQTIPTNGERYTLADFEGLSDTEIISMVKETYGDASLSYQFYTEERNYPGTFSRITNKNYTYENCKLPCNIIYQGELDNSGNCFERQDLKLFGNCSYSFSYPIDSMKSDIISISSELKDCKLTIPTTIKDKEYIGIQEMYWNTYSPNLIITQNSYQSLKDIKFDDPKGSTEW